MTHTLYLNEMFTLQIKMVSDWHIGTGTGRPGNIDKLIARDHKELPYIPAKTLTGVWRDACEQLATALDENKNGLWQELVQIIFGTQPNVDRRPGFSPTPAILSISPAHFPQEFQQLLVGNNNLSLRQALTFVKPGVAINPLTGAAKVDFLRFEEMARNGTTLKAECRICFEGMEQAQKEAVSALLIASLKLIERLGGKRRRGVGKCELTIEGQTHLNVIESLKKDCPTITTNTKKAKTTSKQTSANGDEWEIIPLRLELQTPIVAGLAVSGNVNESLDFLPGTYLLPFVTRLFHKLDFNCHKAIAEGDIILLPATIEIEGKRGLPIPSVISKEKLSGESEEGERVINRIYEPGDKCKQYKPYRQGYITSCNTDTAIYQTIAFAEYAHSSIDDSLQRPTQTVGGLYTRKAIPSGTLLRSELRLKKSIADFLDSLSKEWRKNLEDIYRVGVSKKDDYGLIKITTNRVEDPNIKPKGENGRLIVWLVSDLLLRDKNLRPTTSIDALKAELEKKLVVKLSLTSETTIYTKADIRIRRIESWHTGWGLPRPTLCGLQAGSCVVFDLIDGEVDLNLLEKLEKEGIGERRGEGYGQMLFNPPLLTQELKLLKPRKLEDHSCEAKPSEFKNGSSKAGPIGKESEAYEFACSLEKIVWQDEIQRKALQTASNIAKRKGFLGFDSDKQTPPMSQIASLNQIVSQMQSFDNSQTIRDWIEHIIKTPTRVNKWLDKLEGIKKLIDRENEIWSVLFEKNLPSVLTFDGEERLKKELWAEAIRTFVDACMRAHKREIEGNQKDKERLEVKP
ncbi:MAG: hypothetical protein JNN15_04840 [Blastocatellia bacterium]|nr:hypothetical protein [Blastocatellia bacterium]